MKIAVHAKVLSEKRLNGIGYYTYNLLKALSKIDRVNEYFLYSNTPLFHKIEAENFREKILSFPKLWTYLRWPFEFIDGKYEVAFIPHEKLPFFLKTKSVITVYDLHPLKEYLTSPISLSAKVHFFIAIKYAIKKADKVIAISESTKRDIIENCNISPNKITVTPLGYNGELYKSYSNEDLIRSVKERYGIKGNYIINTSSLLWYRKNLPRLIKAFHICKSKRVINHQLVITGKKGEAYSEIIAMIKSLNLKKDVILTGYISTEDMPILLSGADVLVFPSLYEGFGLPIVEAMACGCPVITSNCSAMPEVALDAGMLVNPYNEEEIANVIGKVIEDGELRNNMRRKGFERIKMFSWERTAKETLKVFESLK
jgi:glycosyltransferase involved in cell wall biosynthesis